MNDTTSHPESNVDLLVKQLKEESLAHDLVTAYRDAESGAISETLTDVLEERLKEIRRKIEYD